MSDSNEKTKPVEAAGSTPSTQNQPQNKNGGLNALLFIGSFLIVVGSGSLLASTLENMAKLFLLLFMVVVFYVAGLLIRRMKVLVPAGTAFVCSSLAVLPFLGNAFYNFANISPELSWLLTSLIGTVAYITAAFIMRSRLITFFSMGFVVSLFCATPTNLHMATLWNYLAVISVSIIANLISFFYKGKIPKDFRDVLTHTARWLAAIVAFSTMFGTFSLAGFDYTIIFAVCLIQFILSYITTKNFTDEVLGRLVFFPLFLSLFWNIFPAISSEYAIIFGLACISEIVYSFFSAMFRPNNRGREIPFIITFMVLSLFAPLFAAAHETLLPANIIAIIITAVNFIITILLTTTWKTKTWLFAAYPLAMLMPLYFEAGDLKQKAVLITYAIEFAIFSAYYYTQKERTKNNLELFNLIFFSVIIVFAGSGLSLSQSTTAGIAETTIINMITYVVPAFCWLIFGLKEENKNKIELAFYFFIVCIMVTTNQFVYNATTDSTIASKIITILAPSFFLISLTTMAFYRKSYARAIVAISVFSYIATNTVMALSLGDSLSNRYGLSAQNSLDLATQLIFLLEEITVAAISAIRRKKATFWISSGSIIVMTLFLARGATYIWFIFFGLAIIGFVIWRLLKQTSKTNSESSKIPESTSPTETESESEEKSEPGSTEAKD